MEDFRRAVEARILREREEMMKGTKGHAFPTFNNDRHSLEDEARRELRRIEHNLRTRVKARNGNTSGYTP